MNLQLTKNYSKHLGESLFKREKACFDLEHGQSGFKTLFIRVSNVV